MQMFSMTKQGITNVFNNIEYLRNKLEGVRKTFISKKRWKALEKKVDDLEKKIQDQPPKSGLSLTEQAFLLAALNVKKSNLDSLRGERS